MREGEVPVVVACVAFESDAGGVETSFAVVVVDIVMA